MSDSDIDKVIESESGKDQYSLTEYFLDTPLHVYCILFSVYLFLLSFVKANLHSTIFKVNEWIYPSLCPCLTKKNHCRNCARG